MNPTHPQSPSDEPPQETPMPVDPKEAPPTPEVPQTNDPVDAPSSPEVPNPDNAPEIPEDDPFDEGNFPV